MIQITEDFEVEYSAEFNNELTNFAIRVGDLIKDLPPLERYYALKMLCDEIDGRATMYTVMGQIMLEGVTTGETKK